MHEIRPEHSTVDPISLVLHRLEGLDVCPT